MTRLQSILQERDVIVAAFVYGSIVTSYFREGSDIDVALLVNGKLRIENSLSLGQDLSQVCGREVHCVVIDSDLSLILRNEIATKGKLLFTKVPAKSDSFLIKTPLNADFRGTN